MLYKKTLLTSGLLLASLNAHSSSDLEVFNAPLEDVVIECFNQCNAKKIAEDYILKRANFAFSDQRITVEKMVMKSTRQLYTNT